MSKTKAPQLFDRALVRRRRGRAGKLTGRRVLYERCALDAAERLLDINRNFENTLLLGNAGLSAQIIESAGQKMGYILKADHTNNAHALDLICDEEALPFKLGSFDLLISALSLQMVNQVPKTLATIRSLLKPDGLFIGALFGGQTLTQLRQTLYEVEDKLLGQVSPRISPMVDMSQAAGLLQSAGFAMPVVDRDNVNVSYPSVCALYTDLRNMGETNALADRDKKPLTRKFMNEVEKIYRRDHEDKNGKLCVSFDMIWMTGWAPHPDQQKPLKPGSAKTRLSEALGVKEHKL